MSQKKTKKQRKLEKQNILKVTTGLVDNISIRKILKQNWKFLLLLSLAVFVIYFNSLWANFVSDDYASISQNPVVKNYILMSKGGLASITNTVIANFFGVESPFSYHLFNLFLYILICLQVFLFVFLIFNKTVAMGTTLLFFALPVHVESVTWISGRPYLLVAFFVLSSLISIILFTRTNKKIYFGYIILNLVLLYITDRIRGFSFIFLLLLLIVFLDEIRNKFNYKKLLLWGLLIIPLIIVISMPMIKTRIGNVNSGYNQSEGIFYNPFFQYPTAISKYLQLLLAPVDLTLYHTIYTFPTSLNWLIFLLYVFSLIYFFIKNKNLFFALAFIFAATAPSMAPVKVSWLVAERYIFLGSLGFCLFLVLSLEPLYRKYKFIAEFLFFSLILIYSFRVFIRNIDWQTNHNLWVNTVQVSPNSHNAWNNIGDDYDKLGQYENAVKGFTQSTLVKTNYADAFHNRANILYKMGRLDLARDSYETALKFSPYLFQTYMSLIQIDLIEKNADLALDHAQKLVQLQPNNPQSLYILGVVYAQIGMKEEARKVLTSLIQAYPDFVQAKEVLNQLK